ncbi:hypothetical protein OGAPHI_007015 [Ogataea philodendri]|uniref:RNA helicase n=1 Tax=Ogataea philodendri TaxID=1378263 RepID=A0A9P8NVY7_9ASCO|nr:uncharacterized protein OGAPHI_007015 [Ogataea philodendri]KAH3660429.1 hypothetical protein OGAPHI_007015 [Ogataea philodendri]
MDIFKILSRGASLKKSNAPAGVQSLQKLETVNVAKQQDLDDELDKEVDFFHQKDHKKKETIIDEPTVAKTQDDIPEPPTKVFTPEEALALRKSYGAKVSGDDIHQPIGSFEDLVGRFKFNRLLLENLISNEFTEPTPIQCEAIPASLADRDLICCAPTGSGKTLAFIIPLVQQLGRGRKNHGIRGLVISPTKELSTQIFNELVKLCKDSSLQVGILNKSIAGKLRNKVLTSSKFDILVSTPLRLIDLLGEGVMDLSKVEQVVFDEADKLFESKFVEQTDRILTACSNPKLRRSIFSATITSSVEELANSIMHSPIRIIIGHKEAANTNIEQKLVYCGNEHGKLLALREMLRKGEFKPPVIIFLQSITRAKALFHELLYDRLNVDVIHAERTQLQRETIIDRFRKGELWCLICTDVLARGIDFKGINLVINYDVPVSAQAYVHRIGRTGRGGRSGKAVTFYTKEDTLAIKPVVNVMKQSGSEDGLADWLKEDLSKLTKQQKKQIKNKVVDRKPISTVPSVVRKKRKQKQEMIDASKKRKTLEESSNN